jgi:hypothetical protein
MKAIKLLLAAALFTGLATLSFAGPNPQFTNQQDQNRKEQQIRATAQVRPAAESAQGLKVCANCNCAAMKKS